MSEEKADVHPILDLHQPLRSFIDYLIIYYLCGLITDTIHFSHPQHLIFGFKLFVYAFFLNELLNKSVKHFASLFINISKIGGELTTC